jgi:acetolactate synthase-1/2/3 large subunit
MTGTPRPAHLDLNGLQAEVVEASTVAASAGIDPVFQMTIPPHRPVAADREIERAAVALRAARRICIVAGEGAMASRAHAEVLAVAEALAAPVATSLGARGIIDTRHRLSIGCVGNYAAPPTNQIVHQADLVFFIGCDTGDQVTHTWRIPAIDTPCVHLDLDPAELGRTYPNTLGLMGDPKATLARLAVVLGKPVRDTVFADRSAELFAAWRESRAPMLASDKTPIWPDRLCAEITRALPPDGILVADTGYSGIWSSTLIDLNGSEQTYLRAAGSLGWAFPAALGAKCAAPHRKVICWSGDGALYYHLTELETARRRGIAVVLVVNNNSGFGQSITGIRRLQGNIPGDPDELGRFGPTNFADVASTFGLKGIRVEHPDQIGPALQAALASDETVVVDVATDIECRAPEPWLPAGA